MEMQVGEILEFAAVDDQAVSTFGQVKLFDQALGCGVEIRQPVPAVQAGGNRYRLAGRAHSRWQSAFSVRARYATGKQVADGETLTV